MFYEKHTLISPLHLLHALNMQQNIDIIGIVLKSQRSARRVSSVLFRRINPNKNSIVVWKKFLIWGFKVDHMLWLNNSGTRAHAFHSSLSRIVCFPCQETRKQKTHWEDIEEKWKNIIFDGLLRV